MVEIVVYAYTAKLNGNTFSCVEYHWDITPYRHEWHRIMLEQQWLK